MNLLNLTADLSFWICKIWICWEQTFYGQYYSVCYQWILDQDHSAIVTTFIRFHPGMLTPIGQTSSSTYHSSHLIHFAFKPKSLTLLALEHLAHKLADFTTQAANDTDTQSRHERYNFMTRRCSWVKSWCLLLSKFVIPSS